MGGSMMAGPTPPLGDRDAALRADERAALEALETWLAGAGDDADDEEEERGLELR